jgi:hypothetical protein
MRRLAHAIGLVALLALPAVAQKPVIQMTKVRTLVDQDGRGFTRVPYAVVPLAQGRFGIQEINELPTVVDSTGRLVKRFIRGGGPGEFQYSGNGLAVGSGDTLYASNQFAINVFGPDLAFIRAVQFTSVYANSVLPLRDGFLTSAHHPDSTQHVTSVHVMRRDGSLLRSFVRDTFNRRAFPQPSYHIALSGDGGVWTASAFTHRIQKWTLEGRLAGEITAVPQWFMLDRNVMDGWSNVASIRESDGVLWVVSRIPVANYREIMTKVVGVGREVDARKIPEEQLSTAYLEAYDVKTGKLLADLPLKAYAVGLMGDHQLVVYTTGANDEAQLEIWDLKLRR